MVKEIKTEAELKEQIKQAGSNLIIIDFFATWCGPCKRIAPELETLSKELTDVVFLKVDCDALESVAEEYNITSMPTFVFIKEGKIVGQFSGANIEKVKLTIQELK